MDRRTETSASNVRVYFQTLFLVATIGVLATAGCSNSDTLDNDVTAGQTSAATDQVQEIEPRVDDDRLVVTTDAEEPTENEKASPPAEDGLDVATDSSTAITTATTDSSPTDVTSPTLTPTSSRATDSSSSANPSSSESTAKPTTTRLSTTSTTTRPTAGSATTAKPPTGAFFSVDFQQSPIGTYTDARIRADWDNIRYTKASSRAEITQDGQNRFVRVKYPKGQVGNDGGGATWEIKLESNASDELYASYRLRFVGDFDPVLGGKLPGLAGGARNTGGDKPNGSDGWSARIMWRRDNAAVQYLYHPDQPSKWGEDLQWGRNFPKNQWITVETRIKMNTPGHKDGVVQSWMNGQQILNRTNIRFRDVDSFGVDSFMFSTFFGGSGSEWAPTKDEYIDFDDFVISNSPIAQ